MSKTHLTIKLISPKMSLRPMDSEFKRRMSPSLTLVTLASLTPKEHHVYIEDENIKPINYTDTPDVVGINVNVDTANGAIEIAKHYKKKGAIIVMGGIHASAHPKSLTPFCDAICVGEAELLWKNIINDIINKKVKKIYSNKNPVDTELIPIPNWNYISKKNYLYHNIITTSRGCPFSCDFCYNSSDYMKSPFRNRSITHVLAEIKSLNTKHIMFIDDNLIGDVKWTKKLIKALKPLHLTWHGAVSANLVHHKELIEEMAEAG